MKKTLTKQWKNGKLPIGEYYIKTKRWGCDGRWHYNRKEDIDYFDGDWRFYQDYSVKEVLAAVPSYDEYCELVKKTHTLEKLQYFCEPLLFGEKQEWERIVKRGNRKEMEKWLNERKNKTIERLQEQLKEANDLIMWVVRTIPIDNKDEDDFDKYIEKWEECFPLLFGKRN